MPDEEFRPGAHDLETPFLFVPHGAPDPVEWKRQHPGWVSFPATFVPHPRPIPKWKIINGQRWPLDKKGRPWPKTRYGRPTCPFDELPPGMPAPGTQYELLRKFDQPTLFFGDEPMPTVEEFSALAVRLRAEQAAAAPPPPVQRPKAYDGDGLGPVRDYMDAMARVDGQLREFAESTRREKAAAARQQQAAEQDAASSQPVIVAKTGAPLQVGADPTRALVAGGTAAAAGPALSGAVGEGVLGRAAAALLGAAAGPAALLGGVLWPSPTGDSTLSGTGLTLADAPGFEPPTLPDQADPGVGIDPDAGRPMVLVTPAAPQAGPSVEVFDPPSVDPAVFDNRTIEQFRDKLDRQFRNLKPVDFDAARQEMAGKIVAEKSEGVPYDHVQKVANAMTGVIRIIGEMTRRLSHPGLSEADRQAVTALLSEASRKIDEARRMVPGIDQRLGDYR